MQEFQKKCLRTAKTKGKTLNQETSNISNFFAMTRWLFSTHFEKHMNQNWNLPPIFRGEKKQNKFEKENTT